MLKRKTLIFLSCGLLLVLGICPAQTLLKYENYFGPYEVINLGEATIIKPDNWLVISYKGRVTKILASIMWLTDHSVNEEKPIDVSDYAFGVIEGCGIVEQVLITEINSEEQKKIEVKINELIHSESSVDIAGDIEWTLIKIGVWDALMANSMGVVSVFVPKLRVAITTEDIELLNNLSEVVHIAR